MSNKFSTKQKQRRTVQDVMPMIPGLRFYFSVINIDYINLMMFDLGMWFMTCVTRKEVERSEPLKRALPQVRVGAPFSKDHRS